MAARTRGLVDGRWADSRAVLRRSGSSWIPANGYVKHNGLWRPLAPHTIYRAGHELYYMTGDSGGAHHSATKADEYLYMWGVGTLFVPSWARFTSALVDLTPFDRLYVQWRNTGHNLFGVQSRLRVVDSGGNILLEYNRRYAFDWRYDYIDVSGLTGNHRVQVEAYTYGNNETSSLYVSRLYLW